MNLLIIQARMGSTRFPGKVLAKIEDTPILKIIFDRVCASKYADQIVVATTENNEDDCLETFCDNNGINVFRGSDWDVLDRFYNACLTISPKPKNIIRVCSDNPLLSCYEVDYVFNAFLNSGMAYFSNSNQEPNFLEDGFDVKYLLLIRLNQLGKMPNYCQKENTYVLTSRVILNLLGKK